MCDLNIVNMVVASYDVMLVLPHSVFLSDSFIIERNSLGCRSEIDKF